MTDFDRILDLEVPVKVAAGVGVRGMTEADLPHVLEIERSSFPDPYDADTMREKLAAGAGKVAEAGGGPVGYLLHNADPDTPGLRYGHSLAVHPDHRRTGVGEALLRAFGDEYPDTSADVATTNTASRGLFKKMGYKTVRTFKADGKRAHRMHRRTGEKAAAWISPSQAAARKETDPTPTEAQKRSGNYRKGRFKWNGLTVVIETPKGAVRSGTSKGGKAWAVEMKSDYGYVAGKTSGADEDEIDVFVSESHPDSELVFVINQVDANGKFDEHKCVLGEITEAGAREAYLANYSKGWTGLGSVRAMTLPDFKEWLDTEPTKAAAYSDPDEAEDDAELEKLRAEKKYLGRYKCPHCGGTNLFNGIPGTGTTFRGSGHCQDCGEGCSIVGLKLKRIGDGPEIVMTDDQIASWRKRRRWERKHGYKGRAKTAFCRYDPHLVLVKRAADETDRPFTIAVDLDGTLAEKEEPFDADSIGPPIDRAVEWVRLFHAAGARIIIFTVRGDKDLVTDWLDEHEVPYDHVNENPDQPEGSSGKVLADVYWDDRGWNAADPDEHGAEILRRARAHAGDEDHTTPRGPAVTIVRHTVVTIHGPDLLAALSNTEDTDDAGDDRPGPPARGGDE